MTIRQNHSLNVDNTGVYSKMEFLIRCRPPYGSGKTHGIQIRLYMKPGAYQRDDDMWVDCDCGFHQYVGEVALANKWDASGILHSNGNRPRLTNPNLLPRICKHALHGLKAILKLTPRVPKRYSYPFNVIEGGGEPSTSFDDTEELRELFATFYMLKERLPTRPGATASFPNDSGKRGSVPKHLEALVRKYVK